MVDRADRRVLGALRLMDATTGVPITRRLNIAAPGLKLKFTRSHLYVIMGAEGLAAHVSEFDTPPALPVTESLRFTLTITDPQRHYEARVAEVSLPRPFDPANGVRDLQTPIDIALASGAARPAGPSWGVAEMRIIDTTDAAIPGALVEIFPQGGGTRMAWGIANDHGEARLLIPGLRPFREIENDPLDEDDNEIVTAETRVEVRATVDPTATGPANPERLAGPDAAFRRATLPLMTLTPGRTDTATLTLDLN